MILYLCRKHFEMAFHRRREFEGYIGRRAVKVVAGKACPLCLFGEDVENFTEKLSRAEATLKAVAHAK